MRSQILTPGSYFTPRTVATSLVGLIAMGILVFVPAGRLAYWQAWVFIVVFAASTQAIGIYPAFRTRLYLRGVCKWDPLPNSAWPSASSSR
jgi:hypothetical protein